MLSSFSLISLIGVMLGVLVLVVVMAVYSGLERNVKNRILGFTPHVLLTDATAGHGQMADWTEAAAMAKKLPHVEAATAFVSDNVILDVASNQRPVLFRGIDTSDPAQIEGISKMLDMSKYPTSSADLGIDDRAVISSTLAEQFALGVGDKLRLYSTRNFEEVMDAYKATENPPVREAFSEVWKKSTDVLRNSWKSDGEKFTLSAESSREAYNALFSIFEKEVRAPEKDLLNIILVAMDGATASNPPPRSRLKKPSPISMPPMSRRWMLRR
jgi:lipoprotein-releasing system permease protein